MKVFPIAILNFPIKPIKFPTLEVIKNAPLCLSARTNPAIAEEQKFSPVRAT